MITVHDGTPNINLKDVNNVKCVNCKNCIGTIDGMYICYLGEEFELVEECVANDDNQGCEGFVEDSYDDFTARCNQRIN